MADRSSRRAAFSTFSATISCRNPAFSAPRVSIWWRSLSSSSSPAALAAIRTSFCSPNRATFSECLNSCSRKSVT
jgi:hypothetical protein